MSTYSTIDPVREGYTGTLPPLSPQSVTGNELAQQVLNRLDVLTTEIKQLKETLENGKSE